jgi:hypothetical protein
MREFNAYGKPDPGNQGLNNASILTFSKDVVDALIKELTQNSIDAKEDSADKVRVKVDVFDMDINNVPGINSLKSILSYMSNYWDRLKQPNFVKFFNNASNLIESGKLHVFSFEDFNTKGLEGDETTGSFKNLIYDEGVSDFKPDNALGGFGIGKNSFFALTALKTVFYSSYHADRGHSFMGVTKLAEYEDGNKVRKDNRVYYGDWINGKVKHVTKDSLIPTEFKRSENGLSSFALGVVQDPDWKHLVIKALIKNYWFLFESDRIEAEVDGELINNENYFDLATEVFSNDTSILAFIETFKNPNHTFSCDVHEVGGIKVLLSEQPEDSQIDFPDKIVFIRDGMMIKEYNLGVRNLPNRVAGIIYCDNPVGNKILSNMEPPAHDSFEPFLLNDKHPTLKESDGKKIVDEINRFKTNSVRSIKEKYNQPTRQVGFVDELLSGLSISDGEGSSVGKASVSKEESFYFAKKEVEMDLKFNSDSPNTIVNLVDDGELKDEGGRKIPSGGKGGTGDSDGDGDGTGTGGKGVVKKRKRKTESISSAKFYYSHTDSGLNHYVLIVYSQSNIKDARLKFTQHGDSPTKAISTELIEVTNESGKLNFINHGSFYEITGLNIKSKLKNKFDVAFKEEFQSAFKIL